MRAPVVDREVPLARVEHGDRFPIHRYDNTIARFNVPDLADRAWFRHCIPPNHLVRWVHNTYILIILHGNARIMSRRSFVLEVEVKFRLSDWTQLRSQLAECGSVAVVTRKDTDHYFNAPDRDFAKTDEALRLRRIGLDNYLTYKGPKREKQTKTRTEIELPIAPGPDGATNAVKLLAFLGYRPVAVVSKTREIHKLVRSNFPIEVCLDDVGTVGKFVELEIQADEARWEEARNVLLATATELGLTEQERRSYLEMLIAPR
jgi:adenylate cyclase class 2